MQLYCVHCSSIVAIGVPCEECGSHARYWAPTEEEIAVERQRVQDTWSDRDREKRTVVKPKEFEVTRVTQNPQGRRKVKRPND